MTDPGNVTIHAGALSTAVRSITDLQLVIHETRTMCRFLATAEREAEAVACILSLAARALGDVEERELHILDRFQNEARRALAQAEAPHADHD